MKTNSWLMLVFSFILMAACGLFITPVAAINLGDSEAAVITELGTPQGRISSGKYDVYIYNRGKIELSDGLVTSIELISAEAAETKRLAREKTQQEAEQQAKDASERRRVEGNRILADRLADPIFRAQPANGQLNYWDIFKKQYPEIDISSICLDLSRQHQAEQDQAIVQEQLADLHQREERIRRAEQAVEEAFLTPPPVTYVAPVWTYYPNSYDTHCRPHVTPMTRTYPGRAGVTTTRPVPVTLAGAIAPTTLGRAGVTTTRPVPVTLAGAIAPTTQTIPATPFITYCNHPQYTGLSHNAKSETTGK
jgi:hypothetical protein